MVTIGMVIPTWGKVCGVAYYTKQLIEHTETELIHFKIYQDITGDFLSTIKRDSIDIVHFQHEPVLYNFNTLHHLVAKLNHLKIPVITTFHSLYPGTVSQNLLISRMSSKVIVLSEKMERLYIQYGCAPEKLLVMPIGCRTVPIDPKEQTKKLFNINGNPCVGFFGFPFPHKGIVNLIHALNSLKACFPDIKGYFFATYPNFLDQRRDPFQKALQSVFDQNSHLIWVKEFLPEPALVNALHCMDVNILPYAAVNCYGMSSAAKMLLAAKRPVVTTDTVFFSDLRDEVYKMPDASVDTIVKSIRLVLTDNALQEQLISNGNNYLQNYSWDRMGSSYGEFYAKVKGLVGNETNLIGTGELTKKLPIRWISSIFGVSDYTDEARNILLQLDEEKFDCKVIPVGDCQDTLRILNDADRNKLSRLALRGELPNPVNITWLSANFFVRKQDAKAYIGRTMFETDRIPPDWVSACNQMDEIWVPSQFNVETFAGTGVDRDKLFVIPGGIDPDIYSSNITPMWWPEKKGFNFLSVFIWVDRKGWDVLLKAYFLEFNKKEDVSLILKINVPGTTTIEKIQRQMQDCICSLGLNPENVPAVFLINKFHSSKEMAALYAACDAFVLPSRGEGWGRPYMEAMAAGLPVIGTRWSGQLEFMNDENSYLINVDGLEDVPHTVDMPIYQGHRWARPSLEHTMALMRYVYENRDQAREKGSIARKEIIEKWSLSNAVEKVEQRLELYR